MYAQQPYTSAPAAGWYPDPQGQGLRYWDGAAWSSAVQPSPGHHVVPAAPVHPVDAQADAKARSIATYERVSGVLWIVIGVLQVASVVLIIAGAWNIFAGITRLSAAPAIERREARVPAMFQGVVGLVLIGLVNLFFGAVFGVVMVVVDFVIRQQVLDNRRIFNR